MHVIRIARGSTVRALILPNVVIQCLRLPITCITLRSRKTCCELDAVVVLEFPFPFP